METLEALDLARRAHPQPPEAGSRAEAEGLARFQRLFDEFTPEGVLRNVPAAYAPDVFFNDTLKSMRGTEALSHYLRDSAAAVEECRVRILSTTRSAEGEHLLRWRMLIRFKRLRRGEDTETVGLSHLRLGSDGRIVYHQDYWNAADGIYEHVPVLGTLIRMIKRRL